MTPPPLAAPFPYFGGKRRAAPLVWEALGDPGGYVEPFAGSAAVLLARPALRGRRVETLNDADGWLVNAWRAIQHDPAEVAHHAYGPVTEIDYHARLAWLQARRDSDLIEWLEGDPTHCDARAAGWWLYVMAAGIGDPFGSGPWHVVDGHLRELPHLGDPGRGINRELPHLGNPGRGINRKLPHLGNPGQATPGGASTGSAHETAIHAYLTTLAARLERVRITCGDWRRVLTPAASRAKSGGDGTLAAFLDPPYATSGDLYIEATDGISEQVREWCLTPHAQSMRIVLAGYDAEHDDLLNHGWRRIDGKSGSGAGYSSRADNGRRERLWLNPHCHQAGERSLLDFLAEEGETA